MVLKVLIIAKPQVLAEKRLASIFKSIEEKKFKIIGVKMMLIDINKFGEKAAMQKENKDVFENAKNAPSVLIAVELENANEKVFEIKKEFGESVYISSGEETAKYELERFFEGELFEHEEESVLEAIRRIKGKDYFADKSIEQIKKDIIRKKISRSAKNVTK